MKGIEEAMILLDANIILRYLKEDDVEMADKADVKCTFYCCGEYTPPSKEERFQLDQKKRFEFPNDWK